MSPHPQVFRPVSGRIQVRLPYSNDNRQWLKDALGAGIRPTWEKEKRYWTLARGHLVVLVQELVERYGVVEVALDYSTSEQCDTRCQKAQGLDCTCSCLGANHGGAQGIQRWTQVGETTLVSSNRRRVIRMVTRADATAMKGWTR